MAIAADTQDDGRRRARRRGYRRTLTATMPAVVWVLAIAAAFHLHQRVAFVGTITGYADNRPVTLAHLEPGIVREVHVDLYDPVTHGQVVVTMDDREERLQLAVVEEDIERLRAEVLAEEARLSAGNAWSTADVDDLARRFVIDRETAHIDYLSQLAQDARDRVLLRGTAVEYEILRNLYGEDNAAFRELNDIQTEVDSLKALVENNAAVLEQKKRVFDEADQRWARFVEHNEVATAYEPVLTPLRLAVDVRRRDLEEIVRRIDAHVLRATVDGQVTELLAHAGDRVQPGTPLVTISPTSADRVVAYLPEQMGLAAKVGASVQVICLATEDSRRREYGGTIVSLSATISEAPFRYRRMPAYPVWGRGMLIALGEDAELIPGEAVQIALSD
jgi:membrane fusion protein (multidrug efflux system)